LRLTARGIDSASLSLEIDQFFLDMKHRVHSYVVAEEDTSLSHSLLKLLKEKNRTLATAESCTGGYMAHLITSVAGSSAVYKGSIVAYANAVKEKLLNVSAGILKQHGAVSEQTVLEMAKAAREKLNTNYAIATSGIMGPDGGTEEKPVGTVWIAVAGEKYSRAQKFFFRFDRSRNIELAANNGLLFLRRFILEQEDERD
jgi:nicotinamide-nucleotide amidase